MRKILLLLFLPLCAFAQAQPVYQGEQLQVNLPYGWHVETHSQSKKMFQSFYLPNGQTLENFEQLAKIDIYYGVTKTKLKSFVKTYTNKQQQNCPSLITTALKPAKQNDYAIFTGALYCPKTKNTQQGRVTIFKVIQGDSSLYMIQRIWQGYQFTTAKDSPLTDSLKGSWTEFLKQSYVCDSSSPGDCPVALKEHHDLGETTQIYPGILAS